MTEPCLLDLSELHLTPDPSRTVIRPFDFGYPQAFADPAMTRPEQVVARVLALDDDAMAAAHDRALESLRGRHRDVERLLERRFAEIAAQVPAAEQACSRRRLVIGAFFSEEYSFEAAALFNPSMVLHPDQSGAAEDGIRFLLSLRGIGEGHISSVTFRTGTWSGAQGFAIDAPCPTAVSPRIEGGAETPDGFTRIVCEGSTDVSESVLFPVTDSQRKGIEDLRLVRFAEEDGSISYLGTYTAFDGRDARCEMLRATGFQTFEMRGLDGAVAATKGLALFPRRLDGRFAMIGRQDNENLWLLDSGDLYTWDGGAKLVSPRYPWEFVQMGNCGSPIEIDEGWLLITHGVGMVRNYCMGACLLDRNDPSKLLARTPEPILRPSQSERDGYVPNVVYSCGGIVKDRTLLLPYGIADTSTGFASVGLDTLLAAME